MTATPQQCGLYTPYIKMLKISIMPCKINPNLDRQMLCDDCSGYHKELVI